MYVYTYTYAYYIYIYIYIHTLPHPRSPSAGARRSPLPDPVGSNGSIENRLSNLNHIIISKHSN